ncbi:MAG: hypothetical protein ACTXOO_04870 [Sodalis sp. (in: enterobacteria)]
MMTISFNKISARVRMPVTHIEIDNAQAVTGTLTRLAQMLIFIRACYKKQQDRR